MKRLLGVLTLALLLGFGGLYLATRESIFSADTYTSADFTPATAALAVLSFLVLWLAPVVKIRALLASQGHTITAWQAFTAHVGQVFGTAMTPSGTGGAPGLVLALERSGVPIGTGVGVAVQLFILDLAALGVLIPIGVAYIVIVSPLSLPPAVTALALGAAVVALVGAVVLARYPVALFRLIKRFSTWRIVRRFRKRLTRMGREYFVSAVAFRGLPLQRLAYLHTANLVSWLSNFVLLWALLSAFGAQARLLDVLAVLSIITLVGFFVPTPGAAGFSELMVGLVVDSRTTEASIAGPVALWRGGTFYVVYLLGPIVAWLLIARGRRGRRGGLNRRDAPPVSPADGSNQGA
ncbi:MAG TPA: lysylphosphatidylglycerol synthase transmembrane domain-containing protein [Trueperaceae bacterium]|nr:lysylphosphatidylglycerol synthase transmembrane domain-containing protein [Trueperaceae bacterium]